jgi:hypothetical protein
MDTKENRFDNWTRPMGSADCPSEAALAEWIRNPQSAEAQAHLARCPTCAAVVATAHKASSEENHNLETFMLKVRLRAQQEAEKNTSKWKVWKNYFTASYAQTAATVAAVIAAALIATTGIWRHAGFPQGQPNPQTVIMRKDVEGEALHQALIELRDSYSEISSGEVSKENAATQIHQLNQVLGKVDENRLQPEQKQQLDALKAQYQAIVFERLQPKLDSSPGGGTKAQTLQTDFFNAYASYLAKDGEQLKLSPDVSLKSRGTKVYVIEHWDADADGARASAANRAVLDLQGHVPDMTLVYKPAAIPQVPTASNAAHSD